MFGTVRDSARLCNTKYGNFFQTKFQTVTIVSMGTTAEAQQQADQETWAPVLGFTGHYEVSNLGRVRSIDRVITNKTGVRKTLRGRVLIPSPKKSGHLSVGLWIDGKEHRRQVHRLVLEAFTGPRPAGLEACHRNGIPTDNRAVNLRWDTHSENALDVVRHGKHHHSAKATCPRGHMLTPPNLIPSRLEKGWRICHACSLATYAAARSRRRSGVTWTDAQIRAEADQRYREKMAMRTSEEEA